MDREKEHRVIINEITDRVLSGPPLTLAEAEALADTTDPADLTAAADKVRRNRLGDGLDTCSIINAKSGCCGEDCAFCAQSSHYQTQADDFDLVDAETVVASARENEAQGVRRFSLVMSGRALSDRDLDRLRPIIERLRRETGISLCASLGFLTKQQGERLKTMGIDRYHHNVETSAEFFPRICTTHRYDDRLRTIENARQAGLEVCAGGIFGLGETRSDRLSMAFTLRERGILSVPINILQPIPGTPLQGVTPIGREEIIRCAALYRCVLPDAVIRLAGGRRVLGADQDRAFLGGINGVMVGNYLTTLGGCIAEDKQRFHALGFRWDRSPA